MKILATILILFAFCACLNAQYAEKNSKSLKAECSEKILNKSAGDITIFVYSDTGKKIQSGYEQFKSDVKPSKTNKIQDCPIDDDNSCSIDKSGSCTSNIFLWGAVSLLTGIIAFAGIKGK